MLYVSDCDVLVSKITDSSTGESIYVRGAGYCKDGYGEYNMNPVLGYIEELGFTHAVSRHLVDLLSYIDSIEVLLESRDGIKICDENVQCTDFYRAIVVVESMKIYSIFDILMFASYNAIFWRNLESGSLVFSFKDTSIVVSFCGDYLGYIKGLVSLCRDAWKGSGMMKKMVLKGARFSTWYISERDKEVYTITDFESGRSFAVTEVADKFYKDGELFNMSYILGYLPDGFSFPLPREFMFLLKYVSEVKYVYDRSASSINNTMSVCDKSVITRGADNLAVETLKGRYSILDMIMCASYRDDFMRNLSRGFLALTFDSGKECFIVFFHGDYRTYITKLVTLYRGRWESGIELTRRGMLR